MRVEVTHPRTIANVGSPECKSRNARPLLGGILAVAMLAGCAVDVRDQPTKMATSRKAPPLILKPYNPPPIRKSVDTPVANTPVGNAPISTVASNVATPAKTTTPSGRGPIDTSIRAEAEEKEEERDPLQVTLYD